MVESSIHTNCCWKFVWSNILEWKIWECGQNPCLVFSSFPAVRGQVFHGADQIVQTIAKSLANVHFQNVDILYDVKVEQLFHYCSFSPPVCLKTDAMDIVFVIDGSSDTQPDAFERMKSLMMTMVNISIVASHHVQFAAILFNEKADVQFQLNQFWTKMEIHKAIFQMQPLGGTADITHALNQAKQVLATDKGGRKAQGTSQFVIVMTNVEARDLIQQPLVDDFRKSEITVITVRTPRSNEAFLRIEGANEPDLSFQRSDAMSQIMNSILQQICEKTKPGKGIFVSLG